MIAPGGSGALVVRIIGQQRPSYRSAERGNAFAPDCSSTRPRCAAVDCHTVRKLHAVQQDQLKVPVIASPHCASAVAARRNALSTEMGAAPSVVVPNQLTLSVDLPQSVSSSAHSSAAW